MFGKRRKSSFQDRRFELSAGLVVPLRIYQEQRNGYRGSIGKKQLIFRLPLRSTESGRSQMLDALSTWARDTFAKDPMHFAHLLPRQIPGEGTVVVMNQQFRVLKKSVQNRASHLAIFDSDDPGTILIELADNIDPNKESRAVETLISCLCSQYYLPEISRRVTALNEAHFQQPISGVTLKLTKSQWGSCSTNGKINLSSRLLLVPERVRDAVIVHELAHRIEMNHSDRFWQLVHTAMPDYETQHAFLKKHGRELSFLPI